LIDATAATQQHARERFWHTGVITSGVVSVFFDQRRQER
jgi:hypothetical protein